MLSPTCVLLLGLVASALAAMEGFVVGGNFANIANYAHSVFLKIDCITNKYEYNWICGASIINQKILLSAGHCLYECSSESHIVVSIGDENKDMGQSYLAYSFMIHEDYVPTTSSNDISLLSLQNSLNLSSKISRVALMKHPPYSEHAKVAGWGIIDEIEESQSDLLKFVPQKVIKHYECLQHFGHLTQGTICASSDNTNEYASQGDSGSALLVRGYIQIGLVSYKIPSVSRNIVIYTDIGYFYDWIKYNSRRIFCV